MVADILIVLHFDLSIHVGLEHVGDIIPQVTGGKVKVSELPPILESLGVKLSKKEVSEVLLTVEVDAKEDTFEKISDITEEKVYKFRPFEENIQNDMKYLDIDEIKITLKVDDNKVNVNDIVPIMQNLGVEVSDEELKEILESLPTDENGRVNLRDFVKELCIIRNRHDLLDEKMPLQQKIDSLKAIIPKIGGMKPDIQEILGSKKVDITEIKLPEVPKYFSSESLG
ncbi:uncharacterized protein LOC141512072 [Macrotis lagotis]|uniref:uncharacterized protein LOC141512072 n=1 Tax=Macrotis lagotis TaxID=92651 RepID=UPI003D69C190